MKLVTYSTPSHREMCQRFVLDRAELAGFADDDIILIEDIQRCGSGTYNSDGFAEQCASKIANLARLPLDEKYLYVDADCCLFPGLRWWCDTKEPDLFYQADDIVQRSTGILLWSHDEKSRRIMEITADIGVMINNHDQNVFNWLAKNALPGKFPVRSEAMPRQVVANYATCCGEVKYWDGEQVDLPPMVRLFHASFCVGVEKKTQLLEMVAASHPSAKLDMATT